MERESFVFYRSFYEGIKELPRDIQGEVLTAIMEYGLNGVTTENQKPITKAMFALIKPQLDANNQRFENGKRGGRPKADCNQTETETKPKQNQTETKLKPNHNQTETKPEPNVNDNVNVNDNDISFLKKETKSARVDFDEEGKNNQPLSDQKETSPQVAPAPPPFNFRKAMLSEGFAPELVDEWLKIRKAKKAINTERAFKTFIEQVRKTNQDINTVLSIIVQKQWKGFEADWLHSAQAPLQSPQQTIIDEYGNIITPTNHYTPPSGKPPYVAGRQTAEDIRNNSTGWGTHTFGNS